MTPPSAKGATTIVVPTYNRSAMLAESLDSLLAQTRPAAEILVVDDGSTDDTRERVAVYGARVRYLWKPNGGKAAALNFALPQVRTDYVWLFDDDDVALPDAIAHRAAALDADPELGFVYTPHVWGESGPDGRIVPRKPYRPAVVPAERALGFLLRNCFFTLQSVLARKSVFDGVGGFNEAMARSEDYEMMIRMARNARYAMVDHPSFVFRRHGGARGSPSVRHAAADRDRVHLDYDGRIGRWLRATLDLRDYLPAGAAAAGALDGAARRLALFNRMAVMASKGLVAEMLDDLREASAIDAGALRADERALCEESMHYMYFWMRLTLEPAPFFARSAGVARSAVGAQALRAYATGMLRHAKSYGGPMRDRLRRLAIATRLVLLSLRAAPAGP